MYSEVLLEEIEKGKISQVYLFQGEEDYLKIKALNQIKEKFFQNPAAESFNFRIFYGKDLDCANFLEEINTFPVLSNRKLLIIKEADKLNASSRDKIAKELVKTPPFLHLIFFFQKVDKRQKLIQAIQSKGKLVYFYPLKDNNLKFWVATQFKKRKKEITPQGIAFLLNKAGSQLGNLEQEIEKVSLYAGSKNQIELDDVKAASSEYQTQDIYDLADKIMERDVQASLTSLSRLMPEKKGTELIALFYWQYSRVFQAKILQDKGMSAAEIGRKLKIPPYYLSRFLNRINSFSREELKGFFYKLFQSDLNLKLTRFSPKLALELLLISLCLKQTG